MKLHDNSRFDGVVIVVPPYANLFKSQVLVELSRTLVRRPHLQVNVPLEILHTRPKQTLRDTFSPVFGGDRHVQNLTLVIGQPAPDQEPSHRAALRRHPEFVVQVLPRIPPRRPRRLVLNGLDPRKIVRSSPAEYWHHEFIIM